MIVFVAGMPRSGSTFTFNVVRELLEARGSVHQIPTGRICVAVASAGSVEHLLLKGHEADEMTMRLVNYGAIKSVCSVRKPEDAIASWMNTFGYGLDDSIQMLVNWLPLYRQIREHSLTVPFELIDTAPQQAASMIAQYVCPDASAEEVDAICRRYTKDEVQRLSKAIERGECEIEDLGFSYYDKRTFFHRRHVTSLHETKARDRIDVDQLSRIRAALAEHCDSDGNLVWR